MTLFHLLRRVRRLRTSKLIDVGIHFLSITAEIDGLADEGALNARVRIAKAFLEGFGARKSGDAVYVGKPKALIDLRIDPQFSPLPQSDAGIKRNVCELASLAATREAVGSLVGRPDRRIGLLGKGCLAVEIYPVSVRWR